MFVITHICASGAKAKDLPISNSAATPLLVEVNYLSNHNDIIRAKLETQAALARERTFHQELKMQLKQTKTVTDGLQRRIETLQTERTNLKANKTSLGKADAQLTLKKKELGLKW